MSRGKIRFIGVELYFDDVDRATRFYRDLLGLAVAESRPGDYSKFASEGGFLCLERKGLDTYPSENKAVVFLEVADVQRAIEAMGSHRIVHVGVDGQQGSPWAVMHDPEGHNVILLQARGEAEG
jgi:predicted enzyme related to lactoylglutathione lyase